MASAARALPTNVSGDLFVDDSCIDCGACRWMAPSTFDAAGDQSRVHHQPGDDAERTAALEALVACPTGSIGARSHPALAPIIARFPRPIAGGVHHCGFHSEDSFGAASYFVVRPGGNVLVDSPRFTRPLVRRLEAMGGVALMFLTHRDDVADHARFADHFGCRRIIHAADVTRDTRTVEQRLEGDAPIQLDDELVAIPTPGHTRGSACLLYRDQFLFSGDHVAYSLSRGHVYAFADACWYDWRKQIASMERLTDVRFEHLLPGHGAPCHFPAGEMRAELRACVDWMRRRA